MQTSYPVTQAVGHVGGIADNAISTDKLSKVLSAATPIGVFVVRDADDNKVKVPTLTTDISAKTTFGGVVLHTFNNQQDPDAAVPTYLAKEVVPVMRKGRVFVKVEEAVTQGDQAFVRFANGVADTALVQKGSFRKSADTATAVALPGAYYASTADAGGIAVLDLNLGG